MFCRLAPIIGVFAAWFFAGWIFVLSGAPALAQVNIDQGKSTAEIFSNDCGTCHKTAKGLANGKNNATLAGFLREHYTSSAQQAASLAAYVLGAGSGPPPSASLKPGTGEPKAADAKNGEAKPGEKPGAHPGRPEPSSTAKLQQPDQDTKIEAEPAAEPGPAAAGRKPAGKHEPRTASRGPRQEPETPAPTPQAAPIATPETAPVATAPATTTPAATPATTEPSAPAAAESPPATTTAAVPEASPAPAVAATPSPEAGASTSAAAPAETPSDSAPVPRDDIPD